MNHFRRGFADELLKLAAFPQHERDATYDSASAVDAVMKQTQGDEARAGLKAGAPVNSAPAPKNVAPTPLTTPNHMVNYSGRA
jgi:hypothetical protein